MNLYASGVPDGPPMSTKQRCKHISPCMNVTCRLAYLGVACCKLWVMGSLWHLLRPSAALSFHVRRTSRYLC